MTLKTYVAQLHKVGVRLDDECIKSAKYKGKYGKTYLSTPEGLDDPLFTQVFEEYFKQKDEQLKPKAYDPFAITTA